MPQHETLLNWLKLMYERLLCSGGLWNRHFYCKLLRYVLRKFILRATQRTPRLHAQEIKTSVPDLFFSREPMTWLKRSSGKKRLWNINLQHVIGTQNNTGFNGFVLHCSFQGVSCSNLTALLKLRLTLLRGSALFFLLSHEGNICSPPPQLLNRAGAFTRQFITFRALGCCGALSHF